MPRFRFGLQARLDQAIAEREALERRAAGFRARLEQERSEEARRRGAAAGISARIAAERGRRLADHEDGAPALLLAERSRFLLFLHEDLEAREVEVANQMAEVRAASTALAGALEELARGFDVVRELERIRDAEAGRHQRARERREEARRDDETVERWRPGEDVEGDTP